MTMTSERVAQVTGAPAPEASRARRLGWGAAILGIAAAAWAIAAAANHGSSRVLAASLVAAWALTSLLLARRGEPVAAIVGLAAAVGGVGVASRGGPPL